ncbi:TPA_asm: hypothetical protein [Altiarchaeum virus]|nr:TPA_asm: hypothetical protein [Altiarchaeum virus]
MPTKYENSDAALQGVIGVISIIIVNFLNYFGLLKIFFGDADVATVVGIVTTLIFAMSAYLLSRTARKAKEAKEQRGEDDMNIPTSQQTQTSQKKEINAEKIRYPFRAICETHFHFPKIFPKITNF